MATFIGYEQIMARYMSESTRQSKIITGRLQMFVDGNGDLNGMTFKHIGTYLETGEDNGRLGVALMDSGITPDEIVAFRSDGKTAKEVAQIWLDNK